MKTIKIKIPFGLKPLEEIKLISERLTQRMLSSNGKQIDKTRIGDQIDIEYLKKNIEIEYIGEKPIEMLHCNVCDCDYQSDLYFKVHTNYGGKNKIIKTCSHDCQEILIGICGDGRAAKTKGKLKPVRFY